MIIQKSVELSIDLNAKDANGWTAFLLAIYYHGDRNIVVVKTIMQKSVELSIELNTRGDQLWKARSGITICCSPKLEDSKNTNFGFLPFTFHPFFPMQKLAYQFLDKNLDLIVLVLEVIWLVPIMNLGAEMFQCLSKNIRLY